MAESMDMRHRALSPFLFIHEEKEFLENPAFEKLAWKGRTTSSYRYISGTHPPRHLGLPN